MDLIARRRAVVLRVARNGDKIRFQQLPNLLQCHSVNDLRQPLIANLRFKSEATRRRNANYLTSWFFPNCGAEGDIAVGRLNLADIQKARRHLRAADPVMKAVIDAVGPFTLRLERDRFGMLVRSIISQQISTSAARSIRRRLQELAGPEGLKAANLAQFTVDQLRSVGLSPQKASYVADLAGKVNDGTVDLRQIGRLSDERIVEQLTQVKGIGRWTAQMFLIFSLGRLDVFPHDDLGVRMAIRNRYGLADLPDKTDGPSPLPLPGDPTPRWQAGIVGERWIWRGRRTP